MTNHIVSHLHVYILAEEEETTIENQEAATVNEICSAPFFWSTRGVSLFRAAPHPFSGPPETLAVFGRTQLLDPVCPVCGRREIGQRRVRPHRVVVLAPGGEDAAGLVEPDCHQSTAPPRSLSS